MTNRNYGIDFLKLLSMFMVVTLHVLGQGGVLTTVGDSTKLYWVAWFMEISAYCAVNCFGIISGYLAWNSKPKVSRLASLWLQVAFYTVLITVIVFCRTPEARDVTVFQNAFLPISSKQYWYISAFFFMYLFMPVLNAAVEHLKQEELLTVLLGSCVAIFLSAIYLKTDAYMLKKGYSALWLMILYLIGGYIGKYDALKRLKPVYSLMAFFACIIGTFAFKFINHTFFDGNEEGRLISYLSPTIILAAICLFSFCTKIRFAEWSKKAVAFLSPAALGIYILHVNPLIWKYYFKNCMVPFLGNNGFTNLIKIGVAIVAIYFACMTVEIIRIYLFKWLHIPQLCARMDSGWYALRRMLFQSNDAGKA